MHGRNNKKIQFTRTGSEPDHNRNKRQFNTVQYCTLQCNGAFGGVCCGADSAAGWPSLCTSSARRGACGAGTPGTCNYQNMFSLFFEIIAQGFEVRGVVCTTKIFF